MREKSMWKQLKRTAENFRIGMYRIETGAMGVGTPDVHFAGHGVSGWIELKYGGDALNTAHVHYRPGQVAWIKRYQHHNPRVYVLLRWNGCWYLINKGWKHEYSEEELLSDCSWSGVKLSTYRFVAALLGTAKVVKHG